MLKTWDYAISCKAQKYVWYEICIINIHKTRLNSWRIWHNDICLLLHVNEFFTYMISIHLMRLHSRAYEMNAFESFFIAFFLFLLVYLNFIRKLCTWVCAGCVQSWDEFFKWEFSCEMLKGSNDEHQSTNSYGISSCVTFSTCFPLFCFHTSIESHFMKVKTFWIRQKLLTSKLLNCITICGCFFRYNVVYFT